MLFCKAISSKKVPVWPKDSAFETFIPDKGNEFVIDTEIITGLVNGHKYMVDVIAINGAGLSSRHESPGVTVDNTLPVVSEVM